MINKSKYYWPNLKSSLQIYINDCEICQQSIYKIYPVTMHMNITLTARKPFHINNLNTFTS